MEHEADGGTPDTFQPGPLAVGTCHELDRGLAEILDIDLLKQYNVQNQVQLVPWWTILVPETQQVVLRPRLLHLILGLFSV